MGGYNNSNFGLPSNDSWNRSDYSIYYLPQGDGGILFPSSHEYRSESYDNNQLRQELKNNMLYTTDSYTP